RKYSDSARARSRRGKPRGYHNEDGRPADLLPGKPAAFHPQSARTRQRKPGCALSLRSRASVSPDLRSSRATSRRLSPSSSVMHRVASLLPDSLVDFRCLALTGRPVITNLAARMHIHDDIALLAFRDSKPGTVPGRTTVRRFGHLLQDRVLDGKSLLFDVLLCNVEAIGGKGGGTEAEQRAQPQNCELHGASPCESAGSPPNGVGAQKEI